MTNFVLAKVLKKKRMSQYKLAKLMNVTTAEVYRWCQNEYNPTLKTMLRLSEVLQVPLNQLVGETYASIGGR